MAAAALIGLAVWFESRPPPPAPPPPTIESETVAGADLPAGWWSFPVDMAVGASRGDRVLVLIVETGETTAGFVAEAPADDPFGSGRGMVAVPPDRAPATAAAAARGGVVILHSTD